MCQTVMSTKKFPLSKKYSWVFININYPLINYSIIIYLNRPISYKIENLTKVKGIANMYTMQIWLGK